MAELNIVQTPLEKLHMLIRTASRLDCKEIAVMLSPEEAAGIMDYITTEILVGSTYIEFEIPMTQKMVQSIKIEGCTIHMYIKS